MVKDALHYRDFGDDYSKKDLFKKYASERARSTSRNLEPLEIFEISASRGESAHVIDVGPFYIATVIEGLGTKNKIADGLYAQDPSKTYYDAVAIDTVAAIVNDLIVVGAQPLQVLPHWSMGDNTWLDDEKRAQDLVDGWVLACNEAGAVYAGGETPTNRGIIYPDTIELSGAATGIINPKERLTLDYTLQAGDHIVMVESSGLHANGASLARGIVEQLPDKYLTQLPSGRTIGEALLTPTYNYAELQNMLFEDGVEIHYMVNVTGHGLPKLMRARQEFTYRIHTIPTVAEEFLFLQEHGPLSKEVAYGTFNMGNGFAFFVPETDVTRVQHLASEVELTALDAGIVEEGPKQVIIDPLDLVYGKESLDLR